MAGRSSTPRRIGRWGTAARVVVGVGMTVGAAAWGIGTLDAVLGLVAFPAVTVVALALRGRHAPPLRLGGSVGCCIAGAIGVAAFVVVPVAALLFFGTAMLIAVVRGDAGCELFAVSNWVRGRDDQIACPLFEPIDTAASVEECLAVKRAPTRRDRPLRQLSNRRRTELLVQGSIQGGTGCGGVLAIG